MKKLTLLLFSTIVYSQSHVSASIGTDIRNSIVGSNPTKGKPALDFILGLQMVSKKGGLIEIGYESFNTIQFKRYNVAGGLQIPLNYDETLKLTPTIEYSMIDHKGGFDAFGANLRLSYDVTNDLAIAFKSNLLQRPDDYNNNKIVLSNYLELLYIFHKH